MKEDLIIASGNEGKIKCIADDSGIEIEYLNGFPGVNTKRWIDGTDRENDRPDKD